MRAIVCARYGPPDVLAIKEVDTPTPKDNEVLIKVHAASVTMGDCELRALNFPPLFRILAMLGFGFRGPRKKILGQELSGEIESVGKQVTRFKKGDQVLAVTGFHLGAYAEFDCLPEIGPIAVKPVNMSFEEAAVVPIGALTALHFLRKGNIAQGQKIVIIGAGGSIGTFAVQLARMFGAEVTAVDSAKKLEMLRSIGANRVVDYEREDFAESGEIYDAIFDVVGKTSVSGCVRSLKENGVYLLGNPNFSQRVGGMRSGRRVVSSVAASEAEDLAYLKQLIEAGKIRSVIDKSYSLEQTAHAHEYVESGQKLGNVVIVVSRDSKTIDASSN